MPLVGKHKNRRWRAIKVKQLFTLPPIAGVLTVILILAVVSFSSINFYNLDDKNGIDEPVLYTPKPTQIQSKAEISNVAAVSYDPEIKVYDGNSTKELKGINWGSIFIGQTKNYEITVTNTGAANITLQLTAINWTPGIDANIEWEYNGTVLPANVTLPITLCLKVNSASASTFDNDIVISATNA